MLVLLIIFCIFGRGQNVCCLNSWTPCNCLKSMSYQKVNLPMLLVCTIFLGLEIFARPHVCRESNLQNFINLLQIKLKHCKSLNFKRSFKNKEL